MLVIGMSDILNSAGSNWADVLATLFVVPYLLGLFGYCFSVVILTRPVWQPFLIFYIVWNVMYYYLTGIDLMQGMTQEEFLVAHAFGWLFSIPSYIALYKYGGKNYPLWADA
jgi:hypothetical protein